MAELTPRQRRFVRAYLERPDPAAAARAAGWGERRAARVGEEMLENAAVAAALEAAERRRRRQREAAERERVLDELKQIAFAPGGDGRDSDLKFSNKLRALKLLLDVFTPPEERVPDPEDEDGDGLIQLAPLMKPGKPPDREDDFADED